MSAISFFINDQPHEVSDLSSNLTLLNYLRYYADLPGTKEGCAEGDCGACSVVVLESEEERHYFRAINSCLLFLPALHGRRVYTVEGLQSKESLHPTQEAMVRHLGSQCGYCTPGFVMSLFEACYREDMVSDWQLDDQLCGNLCRCTGYQPIRAAGKDVAGLSPQDAFKAYLSHPVTPLPALAYEHESSQFWRPNSFESLFSLRQKYPQARLIAGATDLALDVTKFNRSLDQLISLEGIAELKKISRDERGWLIGSGVTLSRLESALAGRLPSLENMLRYFASRQIKNRATVGGNIANASPIGDLAPVFLSLDAVFHLRGPKGVREVASQDFFLDYRKTAIEPLEIMEAVFIPALSTMCYANAYKVSKRKEMDISAVAAGFCIERNAQGEVVRARFGFGGMAATPKRATLAEKQIVGSQLYSVSIKKTLDALKDDFKPLSDHRGTSWYREQVARNLLLGFFEEALKKEKANTIKAGALAHPEVGL